MINWYDIQVEQEIAQERYQPLIQERQFARPHQPPVSLPDTAYTQVRNWLGDQLVSWGCRLKAECEWA